MPSFVTHASSLLAVVFLRVHGEADSKRQRDSALAAEVMSDIDGNLVLKTAADNVSEAR